jgi:hypothetical protein
MGEGMTQMDKWMTVNDGKIVTNQQPNMDFIIYYLLYLYVMIACNKGRNPSKNLIELSPKA